MPSLKTCTPASTENVSSKPISKKTTTGEKTFRNITKEHVSEALTQYLRTLSMINDDQEVTYFGIGHALGHFEYKVEKCSN